MICPICKKDYDSNYVCYDFGDYYICFDCYENELYDDTINEYYYEYLNSGEDDEY